MKPLSNKSAEHYEGWLTGIQEAIVIFLRKEMSQADVFNTLTRRERDIWRYILKIEEEMDKEQ